MELTVNFWGRLNVGAMFCDSSALTSLASSVSA